MATRPYDEEELSISLSPSQIRRRVPEINVTPTASEPNNGKQRAGDHANAAVQSHREKGKTEQRVGQYNIIRTLGEGSFGKVKLAVHRSTGQQVALKIISRKKLISRDMVGRVEREIEYLQLLRHPHIIKLYTVIKTSAEIIMVLEYAGGELFDYIVSHGRMQEDKARRFFQQMICAVEYCHRHKVVHRDLKPENLLLDDNLNVKIADFGLSNIMTDGNFLKTSCGSPNYAAPEVISGKLYAGPEVDVWSCGVILYVLLIGRLPFDDDHIPSLFAKIQRGVFNIPSWCPVGAANMIRKMLVVNPLQRATIEEIRQDLWFAHELPSYLAPPLEEFLNTGVDPNKAINPSDIAPHATQKVQEKLHNEVTEKISKTMGYGKRDVEEALGADEPSAIKDAYMIVRENKLMQVNRKSNQVYLRLEWSLVVYCDVLFEFAQAISQLIGGGGTASYICSSLIVASYKLKILLTAAYGTGNDNPYFASSPPTTNHEEHAVGSLNSAMQDTSVKDNEFDSAASPLAESTRSNASTVTSTSPRGYVSKIGILPTSLPALHKECLDRHNAGDEGAVEDQPLPDLPAHPRTPAEHQEAIRRLKPHSKGNARLDDGQSRPAPMTPVVTKKNKPVRWQFGIRSRNAPWEALLCIYKALHKLNATWVVNEDYDEVHGPESDQ